MKKSLAVSSIVLLLNGCGGGGSGGNDTPIGPPTGPVTPVAPVLASINAADAFSKFINTNQNGVDLPSNDGFLGTANLIIRTGRSPLSASGPQPSRSHPVCMWCPPPSAI
ncbi:MAG: hypothetical protein NTY28_01980, partial [Janthinobacterium sp.]|nr:hypothetical protein [Janthinobacterium sp.]